MVAAIARGASGRFASAVATATERPGRHADPSRRGVGRGIGRILCAVDDSDRAADVLGVAAELARRLDSDDLIAAHVIPAAPTHRSNVLGRALIRERTLAGARKIVERAIVRSGCERDAVGTARFGDPAETVIRLAIELDADLIVVGSRGRGALRGLVLGSVSQGVVRGARRPVVVVPVRSAEAERGGGGEEDGRSSLYELGAELTILCGVSDSPQAFAAVRWAGSIASAAGGRVVLAHVRGLAGGASLPPAPVDIAGLLSAEQHTSLDLLNRAGERLDGIGSRALLGVGEPASCLEQFARNEGADLIAVGSRARGALGATALGSTATALMALAKRPVLVVPHAAATSVPDSQPPS